VFFSFELLMRQPEYAEILLKWGTSNNLSSNVVDIPSSQAEVKYLTEMHA
jgi:hypothetical protein